MGASFARLSSSLGFLLSQEGRDTHGAQIRCGSSSLVAPSVAGPQIDRPTYPDSTKHPPIHPLFSPIPPPIHGLSFPFAGPCWVPLELAVLTLQPLRGSLVLRDKKGRSAAFYVSLEFQSLWMIPEKSVPCDFQFWIPGSVCIIQPVLSHHCLNKIGRCVEWSDKCASRHPNM